MSLLPFPLLTDENIHADVVQFLRSKTLDVLDVRESGLIGVSDTVILQRAWTEGRVVVTHDRDFGSLGILSGQQFIGVVYLRPGHIDPHFTINSLTALLSVNLTLVPPFIVVVRQRSGHVMMRVRRLP